MAVSLCCCMVVQLGCNFLIITSNNTIVEIKKKSKLLENELKGETIFRGGTKFKVLYVTVWSLFHKN